MGKPIAFQYFEKPPEIIAMDGYGNTVLKTYYDSYNTLSYSYNAKGQNTGLVQTGTGASNQSYTYDANGKRTQKTVTDATKKEREYAILDIENKSYKNARTVDKFSMEEQIIFSDAYNMIDLTKKRSRD